MFCNVQHLIRPGYRADIDGLRAIAVISVVGFHVAPGRVQGGFIGVDIFFVISGFLISTIILSNLNSQSFSFGEFYSRRIRRIFPALLIVLIASYAIGWVALLADEYKQLGKHIAGSAGFVSNFILWKESGYFDNTASTKPLLHLWSLGIEEQFYILWPLLLWFSWKQKLNFLIMILVISIISFILNVYYVKIDGIATFYSPLTRFWELSVGSILAYVILYNRYCNKQVYTASNLQSLVGATIIVTGILVLSEKRVFPGWWAILPTIGTALIISAGPQAWLNRVVLSNRVLVWFGLISFPLYLWHWPLLSFLRIIQSAEVSQEKRLATILASIVLAWLTHELIEKPIRSTTILANLKTVILFTSMIIVGCVGYNCYKQDGFSFRGTQPQLVNEGDIGPYPFFQYLHEKFNLCTPLNLQKEASTWNEHTICYQSEKGEVKQIALIGDSHAQHLFIGLAEELRGINIVFYTREGVPFINRKEFNNVFKYLIDDRNINTIIISARWSAKLKGLKKTVLESELLQTVDVLTAANKKIFIIDGVPEFSFDPAICKYRGRLWQKNNCTQDIHILNQQFDGYYPVFKSVAEKNKNLKIIKTAELFCGNKSCSMAKNGILFFRDNNHLNINGSKYLGKFIVQNNPGLIDH